MTEFRQNYRIGDLNIDEINRMFSLVADRLDQMEGFRGTPKFQADVDMSGNRATNAGAAVEDTDLTQFLQVGDEINARITSILTYNKPIGTIHMSINPSNPATYLGYGTWVAFGTGRVIFGVDTADADFDTVEKTGGSKTIGNHDHSIPSHQHPAGTTVDNDGTGSTVQVNDGVEPAGTTGTAGAGSLLPPYICVYIWKRTA